MQIGGSGGENHRYPGKRVISRKKWAVVENGAEVMVKLNKEKKYSFIGPKNVVPDHGVFVLAKW